MSQDLAYDLFKAVEIIVDKQISAIQYDKTIICRIVDDSKAEEGEYVVTDGTSTFRAYTDIKTYKKNLTVYVTIPCGDFNNDKIITGKYIKENDTSYTYSYPTDNFLDITKNLITSVSEIGILANGDKTNVNFPSNIILKENGLKYTRLAVKASFRTLLKQYETIGGSYGLGLRIKYLTENLQEDYAYFELDSHNMNGDPYDFESYYPQEAIIDISNMEFIKDINLFLYQKKDFINSKGEAIPHGIEEDGIFYPFNDNIFVNDVYIALGFEKSSFNREQVLLSIIKSGEGDIANPNLKTFYRELPLEILEKYGNIITDYNAFLDNFNTKVIKINSILINPDTELFSSDYIPPNAQYKVYRFDPEQELGDSVGGKFWTLIEQDEYKSDSSFKVVLDKNKQKEEYKVVLQIPNDEVIEEEYLSDERVMAGGLSEKELEEIRAYYEAKIKTIVSDNLIFENKNIVANEASVNKATGLQLVCDPEGLKGVYNIYKDSGDYSITPLSESKKKRYVNIDFITSFERPFGLGEKVVWKIPKTNTMVFGLDPKDNYVKARKQPTSQEELDKKDYYIITRDSDNKLYYKKETSYSEGVTYYENYFSSMVDNTEEDCTEYVIEKEILEDGSYFLDKENCKLPFTIANKFSRNFTNNTITCVLERDGVTYTRSIDLLFGTKHNNGTSYRLEASFEDGSAYLPINSRRWIQIKVYNSENEDVTNQFKGDKATLKIEWLNGDKRPAKFVNIDADSIDKKNLRFSISTNEETPSLDNYAGIRGTESGEAYRILEQEENRVRILEEAVDFNTEYTNIGRTRWTEDGKERLDENGNTRQEEGVIFMTSGDFVEKYGSYVLSITLSKGLRGLFPVPVSASDAYSYMIGPTEVVYDSNNVNPGYYTEEIALVRDSGEKDTSLTWTVEEFVGEEGSCPVKETEGKIQVPTLLTSNTFGFNLVFKKGETPIWVQPVPMWADVWQLGYLNAWDGNLFCDEENNSIMAAMVGAGEKDAYNRFSGVLMGAIAKAQEEATYDYKSNYGLYGYSKGTRTFCLDTNGKLILGAKGKGQIMMDGNEGIIQSSIFSVENGVGMQINLTESKFTALGKSTEGVANAVIMDCTNNNNIFTIKSDNKPLLSVGNEYFLQSKNFSDENFTGTKIDLSNGKITSYSLDLFARSGSDENKYISISTNPEGNPLEIGKNFTVNWLGQMSASSGKIGPFDITDNYIGSVQNLGETDGLYLGKTGLSIGDQVLFNATNGEGKFGPFTFNAAGLHLNGMSIGKDGLNIGNGMFKMAPDGNGKLAGWTIDSRGISNGNIMLGNSGTIECDRIKIGGTFYGARKISIPYIPTGTYLLAGSGSDGTLSVTYDSYNPTTTRIAVYDENGSQIGHAYMPKVVVRARKTVHSGDNIAYMTVLG